MGARVLSLLAAFLVLLAAGGPVAAAQEPDAWDDPATWEDETDPYAEDAWQDPSDMAPDEAAAPVDVPADIELPARPWTPPTPAAPATPPAPSIPSVPVPKGKIIPGRRALIRADGKAAIPRGAPKRVRVAIAAANKIVGKPYKWGGGHGRLYDSGYDCSGTVGYSLVHAGLMGGVMVSGQMARWGSRGDGRWITVYANRGHVYMEVAGLRLDTSPVGDPSGRKGVRWRPVIGRRGGFAARHPAGL